MTRLQGVFITLFIVFLSAVSDAFVIKSIPPEGMIITVPGTYRFHEDLKWSPTENATAISILASDVILDMEGHTLESTASGLKTIGVSALQGSNIKIRNGKIQNMGLAGVQCTQCTNVRVENIEVKDLSYRDIIVYTVPTGILCTQCYNVYIKNCQVKDLDVTTGSTAAIQMTETFGSVVRGCHVKNMLNRDGACTGIGHLLCADAKVESCKIDNLRSQFESNLNTEGHTTIGIVPVLTTGLIIQKCKISNIFGCCDDAHGMSVFVCAGALVDKCKVKNVVDGYGSPLKGAKATGIEIYASLVKVSDCRVKEITALSPEDKQATGFSCAVCTEVEFLRCKAKNVNVYGSDGSQGSAFGYGTGFGWAPDPRPEFVFPATNILYSHCKAKKCQVGFDTWYHIDCLWDHIKSVDNGIAILKQPGGQRTISCSPCSECGCSQTGCYPNPLVVTLTNVAANNVFKHVKIYD